MEELLKKAEELKLVVTEEITEEQLIELIAEKENKSQDIEDKKEKLEEQNTKSKKENKKNKNDEIRVLDNSNKTVSNEIEEEKVSTLGTKKNTTVHNKKIKQAKNGEYYEELADGIGMWSRTGESFLLKDLK